jgi:hypothetical protein
MPLLPDVHALRSAADAIDRTAAMVEADAGSADRLVSGLPWRGPRREVVAASIRMAAGVARNQADAERDLARALRQLAAEVEHELQVLRELADRARRHLEDLLQRARALVDATAAALEAASVVTHAVVEIVIGDPLGALRDARYLAAQAVERMQAVLARLQSLPAATDPIWRQLGPATLAWHP